MMMMMMMMMKKKMMMIKFNKSKFLVTYSLAVLMLLTSSEPINRKIHDKGLFFIYL